MRHAVACLVLIASSVSAHERTHALLNGTSPDGQFHVRAAQVDPGDITYEVVRTRRSVVLHRILSSYQPEEGAGDWPWDESIDAEIHWSQDSRYVIIDEQVHNYIGHVFIVSIRHSRAETIPLPEQEILARTGLHWDRYRIRVGPACAWSSPRHLLLSLAGQVVSGTLPDGRRTYEHRSFTIDIYVSERKAIIATFSDVTEKA